MFKATIQGSALSFQRAVSRDSLHQPLLQAKRNKGYAWRLAPDELRVENVSCGTYSLQTFLKQHQDLAPRAR